MTNETFKVLVEAANQALAHPRRDRAMNASTGTHSSRTNAAPRFEIYHSAPSLCSFKVRSVLFERGIPFRSHDMNIMPARDSVPENYRPEYVRLHGAPNVKYVDGYTGISSVTTQGFDPCVTHTRRWRRMWKCSKRR